MHLQRVGGHTGRRLPRRAGRNIGRVFIGTPLAMRSLIVPFHSLTVPPEIWTFIQHPKGSLKIIAALLLAVSACLLFIPRRRRAIVAKLGGLSWKPNQFCRGWLITGDTGSGKTTSGINQLAHQLFQNEPTWGGLCIDEKGVYWETLSAMARHHGREQDLIHLQVRSDDFHTNSAPPSLFQSHSGPKHSIYHLREVRCGHRHQSRAGRRQGILQEPGSNSNFPRIRAAL